MRPPRDGNEMFSAREERGLAGPAVLLILLLGMGAYGAILYGLVYLVGWMLLWAIGLV